MEAGHPIPDARSLLAGERALEFTAGLGSDDLLVCLISGGGSALVTAPVAGLNLEVLQHLTAALLAGGARIEAVNTLRRHLDRVKGGGLLRVVNEARTVALILSDVIGNSLTAIASGPTAPDPTTRAEALDVLSQYLADGGLRQTISAALQAAPETLKPGEPVFERVQNAIIGDLSLAVRAAAAEARRAGLEVEVLGDALQGEAREVGRELARRLRRACAHGTRPLCLIGGGETTVTLRGGDALGRGGRNQELALAAVDELDGLDGALLIALATDGEDGPTDAAGAAVTGETRRGAAALGMTADEHLSRNDSYSFFDALGDLLRPGPTGTNVNDLVILAAL
jgi:hydroxypyruvate reductase